MQGHQCVGGGDRGRGPGQRDGGANGSVEGERCEAVAETDEQGRQQGGQEGTAVDVPGEAGIGGAGGGSGW